MSTFNRHALSVVILLLPFLLCACGTEHRLVASYSPPPVGTHKFQTPVTLRLTHDFCDQECSFFVPGWEDWTLNLQPSLRDYAIYTARAEFADVEVLDVDSAAPPRRASRLVLRPQVAIRLEQDVPHAERNGFTLYGFELSATVSWTISDPESDQMFLSIPISSNWWEPFTFFSPEKFCSGLGSHFMTALTNDALPGFENAIKKFKELDSFNARMATKLSGYVAGKTTEQGFWGDGWIVSGDGCRYSILGIAKSGAIAEYTLGYLPRRPPQHLLRYTYPGGATARIEYRPGQTPVDLGYIDSTMWDSELSKSAREACVGTDQSPEFSYSVQSDTTIMMPPIAKLRFSNHLLERIDLTLPKSWDPGIQSFLAAIQ